MKDNDGWWSDTSCALDFIEFLFHNAILQIDMHPVNG